MTAALASCVNSHARVLYRREFTWNCSITRGALDHVTKRVECFWVIEPHPHRGLEASSQPMSFNLALQPQSNPQSPSPSSLSSLDDEASARVFFGPIQSPERIFIAEATHKWSNLSSMPIRRSPRISSLQNSQQFACLGEESRAVGTTLGEQREPEVGPLAAPTPEDSSQDGEDSVLLTFLRSEMLYEDIDLEPASALATKISRAHDNPSPPPNMQPLSQESDNPTSPTPTEQHPHLDSDSATPEAPGSAIVDESLPRVQTLISPPVSHEASPTLDHRPATSPATNPSTDLMVVCNDSVPDVPQVVVRHHSSQYM